jgi:hypothetical protein
MCYECGGINTLCMYNLHTEIKGDIEYLSFTSFKSIKDLIGDLRWTLQTI